jgi:hypothetical protein
VREDIEVVTVSKQRCHTHEPVVFLVIFPFKSDDLSLFIDNLILCLFKGGRVKHVEGLAGRNLRSDE